MYTHTSMSNKKNILIIKRKVFFFIIIIFRREKFCFLIKLILYFVHSRWNLPGKVFIHILKLYFSFLYSII